MGLYKIVLTLRGSDHPYPIHTTVVFREIPGTDIEAVWHKLELKSQEKWGRDLKAFDCVLISKRSKDYQAFLAEEQKKRAAPALKVAESLQKAGRHLHPFAQQEMKKPKH